MKVLLFEHHCNNITPEMKKIMEKYSYPQNRRGEIIYYILNKAKNLTYSKFNAITHHLKKENNIAQVGKRYLCSDKRRKLVSCFTIVEVDNSRPWYIYIEENVGDEKIKYHDI